MSATDTEKVANAMMAICPGCKGEGTGRTVFNGYMDVQTHCDLCSGTGEVPPELRYDGLYEYAQRNELDYNELCRVVRAATSR